MLRPCRPFPSLLLALCLLTLPAFGQTKVQLKAADGHPLVGDHFAPKGQAIGGVVLLHMYRSKPHRLEKLC